MTILSVKGSYRKRGVLKFFRFPIRPRMTNEDLEILAEFQREKSGEVISVEIISRQAIEMISFQLEAEVDISGCKMLVNGFQTWSESVITDGSFRLPNIRMLLAKFLRPYGDYYFYRYSGKRGDLHSHTYTYFTGPNGTSLFMGSLDESTGYTIFQGLMRKSRVLIHKDCLGHAINGRCRMLRVYCAQGPEHLLFDEYLAYFGANRRNPKPATGWTSWYNYYTGITEETIRKNLYTFKNKEIPLDVFQIDDGYQTAVGDWLSINDKFPHGMKRLADEIKKCGYKPGLWLAPFICEKKSKLFKEHPDWILRNKRGKPVLAGWNPNWSGYYYALDIQNEGVKRYLEMVFETVIQDWGFSVVKLDFMYAVALLPRNGKSRAAVMSEAMDFLQYIISDGQILGCGVPLAPTFNRVDYNRIGADVSPYWEDQRLKFLRTRERVSTLTSLHNTISRSRLNGRVFLNDPDVFILRKSRNKLNAHQRFTLFFLNNLLGGLAFTSDDINEYDAATMETYKSIFPKLMPEVSKIHAYGNMYEFQFHLEERSYIAFSNLGGNPEGIFLPLGTYFNEKDFIVEGPCQLQLEPYETKCYLKIDKYREPALIGTTGYIFPAAHIGSLEMNGHAVSITFKKGFINQTEIYLNPGKSIDELIINGTRCRIKIRENHRYVRYRAIGSK